MKSISSEKGNASDQIAKFLCSSPSVCFIKIMTPVNGNRVTTSASIGSSGTASCVPGGAGLGATVQEPAFQGELTYSTIEWKCGQEIHRL
jgi:hypothetical protein